MDGYTRPEPFFTLLGLQLEEVTPDCCRMRLPFRPELRTAAEVVHGGAIASLIDSAGVVAVWSNVDPRASRGATANLTVSFLAAAQAVDLIAEARVIRRGRSVVFVEVIVSGFGLKNLPALWLPCKEYCALARFTCHLTR